MAIWHLFFDDAKARCIVALVGHAQVRAQAAGLEPVFERAVQHDHRLPRGSLATSQWRQVMGMRMPKPMALLKASLAEKRVAR